jgi:hypothetical protein
MQPVYDVKVFSEIESLDAHDKADEEAVFLYRVEGEYRAARETRASLPLYRRYVLSVSADQSP